MGVPAPLHARATRRSPGRVGSVPVRASGRWTARQCPDAAHPASVRRAERERARGGAQCTGGAIRGACCRRTGRARAHRESHGTARETGRGEGSRAGGALSPDPGKAVPGRSERACRCHPIPSEGSAEREGSARGVCARVIMRVMDCGRCGVNMEGAGGRASLCGRLFRACSSFRLTAR